MYFKPEVENNGICNIQWEIFISDDSLMPIFYVELINLIFLLLYF